MIELHIELDSIVDDFLQAMALRRPSVVAHSRRVSTFAVRLASQYGMGAQVIENIRLGGLLHDVGKLLVPGHILSKPGRPSEPEWTELRSHPDRGLALVERLDLNVETRDIVLHHHERYDGCGYPDGLSGRDIAWPVRIVTVMDAFDALTSAREYRDPLSIGAARALIAREAGSRFCPSVVSGFLSLPLALLQPPAVGEAGRDTYSPDGLPESSVASATRSWHPAL